MAFIDLTYGRYFSKMDGLLTNANYQQLWVGMHHYPPVSAYAFGGAVGDNVSMTMEASSASKTVPAPHKTIISSGPCMP